MSKAMSSLAIKNLEALRASDLWGPDDFLYSGVQDLELQNSLSLQFEDVIKKFKDAVSNNLPEEQLLELLVLTLSGFDREALDTEDAENLAGNFEKIMDCVGLESSDGALEEWMYGF